LAVREYGILVTVDALLPRGAELLHDFWKRRGTGDRRKITGSNADPGNVLSGNSQGTVEGTIKAVDSKNHLVTISIGSDAGIQVGSKLEVYRLAPEAKYLGQIEVLSLRSQDAVAKPSSRTNLMQEGDRVTTSKIVTH
jgi:hypothetical protein